MPQVSVSVQKQPAEKADPEVEPAFAISSKVDSTHNNYANERMGFAKGLSTGMCACLYVWLHM